MRRSIPTLCLGAFLALTAGIAAAQSADIAPVPSADIPLDELELALTPLTVDELREEATRWQVLLQDSVRQLTRQELRILRSMQDVPEGQEPAELSPEQQAAHDAEQESLRTLTRSRDRVIERLDLVLDQIVRRSGLDEKLLEPEDVAAMRRYIAAVDGIHAETTDVSTVVETFFDWFTDEDGGLLVVKDVAIVLGVTLGAFVLGWLLARAITRALGLYGRSSKMLDKFIRRNLPKLMLVIGFLVGLAALGINITPLVALIGGASFIIAFALQDTLSNFASGVMIMLYKPFDEGDYVDVATIQGTVLSMNLVSTTITTVDNKQMVVPNNAIWGDVITNYTGVEQRRVDLVFGIGYDDDMDRAEAILMEVASAHPKTLDDPAPVVKVHELGDSSVNLVCRPWVRPVDYWEVYWDLTKAAKQRFDEVGISIPFPQRDVHLFAAGQADDPPGPER